MSEVSTNPKDKIGVTKPALHLIPPAAQIEEAVVLGLGAKKYGPYNWRDHSVAATVYLSAAQRHILQWQDRNDTDAESGASHLAHARACLGIMLDAMSLGKLVDDRPPKGKAADLIVKHTQKPAPAPSPGLLKAVRDLEVQRQERSMMPDTQLKWYFPDYSWTHTGQTFDPITGKDHPLQEHQGDPARAIARRTYHALAARGMRAVDSVAVLRALRVPSPGNTLENGAGRGSLVYVAGPMTGKPLLNFPAFDTATEHLVRAGYCVVNPADIDRFRGFDPTKPLVGDALTKFVQEALSIDLKTISTFDPAHDYVMALDGWKQSVGANKELTLARTLGIRVWNQTRYDISTSVDAYLNLY